MKYVTDMICSLEFVCKKVFAYISYYFLAEFPDVLCRCHLSSNLFFDVIHGKVNVNLVILIKYLGILLGHK